MKYHETRLYLIRHVESVANLNPHIVSGRSNHSPISDLGPTQGKELGQSLAAQGIFPDRVHVSPAVRTLATAELVLAELGVDIEPVVDHAIQELDQGVYSGMLRTVVYTPEVQARGEREGKDFRPEGGESMNDVSVRMMERAEHLVETRPELDRPENVFLFTHGVAIRCVASHLFGWSRQETFQAQTPNASVSLAIHDGQDWQMAYIGRTFEDTLLPD